MLRFAVLRILSAIPTLFIVIALAFMLIHAAPGGPFDAERVLPQEAAASIEKAYHLDESLPQQFKRYVSALLKGDLGPSYHHRSHTVSGIIAQSAPISFLLGSIALILAIVVGSALGVSAALCRNTVMDRIISGISMSGISLPVFVIAPLMVLLFSVNLGWLPVSFCGGMDSLQADCRSMADPSRFILPVISLAIPLIAYIARLIRASMIEVLESDYVRTARAQGLKTSTIIIHHALKPASLPLLSYLGPAIAAVLTGSVVVEQIFGVPGLGQFFVNGALNRDYTLVLGLVIFYAVLIIVLNLIVDLMYGFIDPRIRQR